MTLSQEMIKKIEELPPELQEEAMDFIDFLISKRGQADKPELKLDWRGGLSDLRDQYTSVELQHDTIDLWNKELD